MDWTVFFCDSQYNIILKKTINTNNINAYVKSTNKKMLPVSIAAIFFCYLLLDKNIVASTNYFLSRSLAKFYLSMNKTSQQRQ